MDYLNQDRKTSKYRRRLTQLKLDRNSWDAHWRDIVSYMAPRRGRFLGSTPNDGAKKHDDIINSTSLDALRTIAAGLHGGLTSPSRPWFTLGLPDEDLMSYAPVKEYLYNLRNRILMLYAKSNFYGALHGLYKELAAFGVSSMFIEEDFKSVLRCRPLTIGEFYLAQNSEYRVDTLYREFDMTARQLVQKYGKENVSDAILNAYKNDLGDIFFPVIHCVEPNNDMDASREGAYSMAFKSVSFEAKSDPNKVLKESGYRSIPFVAPRWDPIGVDTYGESPGMDALGDVKQLQRMEEKKLKALAKMIDPPMNAAPEMKKQGGSLIPGGINYVSDPSKGFTPAQSLSPDMQNIAFEIDRVERRIKRCFFNDLFMAILAEEKKMTATEIAKRFEEKLVMLGPVLERLQAELLNVTIDRTIDIMDSFNLLPPAPEEIQGMELKIDYISLLAQAQKMIGTTGIEQTSAFIGSLAQLKPEVLDKFNADEAASEYADMVGVPPKLMNSDETVQKIREERMKQMQAEKQKEDAERNVQTGKTLADTKLGENNALDKLLGGIGAA